MNKSTHIFIFDWRWRMHKSVCLCFQSLDGRVCMYLCVFRIVNEKKKKKNAFLIWSPLFLVIKRLDFTPCQALTLNLPFANFTFCTPQIPHIYAFWQSQQQWRWWSGMQLGQVGAPVWEKVRQILHFVLGPATNLCNQKEPARKFYWSKQMQIHWSQTVTVTSNSNQPTTVFLHTGM